MTNHDGQHDLNDERFDGTPLGGADDPRLTAYALGELSGEQAAAVERHLRAHPELRAELAAVAELAGTLTRELAAEAVGAAPALDAARREALERALGAPRSVPVVAAEAERASGTTSGAPLPQSSFEAPRRAARRPMAGLRPWLAAAAVLVIGLTVAHQVWKDPRLLGLRQIGPAQEQPDVAGGEIDELKSPGHLGSGATTARGVHGVAAGPAVSQGGAGTPLADLLLQTRSAGVGSAGQDPAGTPDIPGSDVTGPEQRLSEDELRYLKAWGYDGGGVAGGEGVEARAAPKSVVASGPSTPTQAPGQEAVVGLVTNAGSGAAAPSVSSVDEVLTSRGKRAAGAPAAAPADTFDSGFAPTPEALGDLGAGAPARFDDAQGRLLRAVGYVGADTADRDDLLPGRGRNDRPPAAGESYAALPESSFVRLSADPLSALSTFGMDVDTASYSNVRRFLHRGELPPPAAVRVEELINAFAYDDAPPADGRPLALSVEAAACPWAPAHRLVRIGLRGRELTAAQRPLTSLTLLLDVSGSMEDDDKLPLLVQSLELLLARLRDDDRVAIVTYASGSEVVLPSTPARERGKILAALRRLRAEGSTHASAGIELAYESATAAFLPEGNNRVLLATDGDFNVGVTSHDALQALIAEKARAGVFLTVLGFGEGNLKDDTAELLADKGNGHYAYIDSLDEAHRVLVRELDGTLHTIAKDVKVQVEFNPGRVAAWRLIGYENRALAATDFRDDKKDAGEVGAGHSLTVLYEVVPAGVSLPGGTADLRYQTPPEAGRIVDSPDLLSVNLRWLPPAGGAASEESLPLVDRGATFGEASVNLRFAAAVAAFGMALRGSTHVGQLDLLAVADWAEAARGSDPDGRRAEIVQLIRTGRGLMGNSAEFREHLRQLGYVAEPPADQR